MKGRGLYTFNVSLLKDREYVRMVQGIIMRSILQYALSVYERSFLEAGFGEKALLNVHYRISDALLYETIMLNIRTETITYSTNKKNQMRREER